MSDYRIEAATKDEWEQLARIEELEAKLAAERERIADLGPRPL